MDIEKHRCSCISSHGNQWKQYPTANRDSFIWPTLKKVC